MKKTIIATLSLFAIVCVTGSAYAGTWAQGGGGNTVTVTPTAAGFPVLSFTPSPGTVVEGANTATVFSILTANSKATGDAICYNLVSTQNQVFQAAVDMDNSPAAIPTHAPTADGTPTSGFNSK